MIQQTYNNCQVIGVQLLLLILFATTTVQLLLPLFELLLPLGSQPCTYRVRQLRIYVGYNERKVNIQQKLVFLSLTRF